jgi:hypothetical protein
MATEYYDGSYDESFPVAPPLITYPMQEHGDEATRLISQRFHVDSRKYKAGIMGSIYPFRSLLPRSENLLCVGDQNVQNIGGKIVEFTREWSDVPQTWDDAESFAYTYQIPYSRVSQNMFSGGGGGGGGSVASLGGLFTVNMTVNSVLRRRYTHIRNPQNITLNAPYKLILSGAFFSWEYVPFGKKYVEGDKTYLLAEGTQPKRWKGLIWEILERLVEDKTDEIVENTKKQLETFPVVA